MFVKVLVIAATLAVALAAPKAFKPYKVHPNKHIFDGRIVGGENTTIEQYPHQASLEWYGSHICGASVISETYLITAAHCTDGSRASDFSVRVNSTIVGDGGQLVRVKAFYQNRNFSMATIDWDISILELESPVELGVGVQPIGLPEVDQQLEAGTEVAVSGWGVYNVNQGDLSLNLQVVKVNIVSNSNCQSAYAGYDISPRMICAGVPAGGKDSCQGDSGGPLVANGTLFGIVSWGYGCGVVGYPGVYSSVASLRSYVTEITGL